ncbi:UNVERIFIED_CONTAM: hypothetical protein K2H54_011949 [Gekko kuhli]
MGESYDGGGALGYIPEEAGPSCEDRTTESFVDIHLELLERGQDTILQMIVELLSNLPRLMPDAIRREGFT